MVPSVGGGKELLERSGQNVRYHLSLLPLTSRDYTV
jgi:hypothetical protein